MYVGGVGVVCRRVPRWCGRSSVGVLLVYVGGVGVVFWAQPWAAGNKVLICEGTRLDQPV